MNSDSVFGGLPVIRSGDKVFLIGKMPSFTDTFQRYATAQLERGMLAYDEYSCPFDFIKEHPQWFEWHKRLYFDKQRTGVIITSMLSDVERIKAHKIDRTIAFHAFTSYAPTIHSPRGLIINSGSQQ